MPSAIDLTGKVFGRLTVVSLSRNASRSPRRNRQWLCACECGQMSVVDGCRLTSGMSRSCGCLCRELSTIRATIHGKYGTAENNVWHSMIQRCTDPNTKSWSHYGGRGIAVCERWLRFENFLADMGERPTPQHTIERINNNGDYAPENCKWATRDEQARNKQNTVLLTSSGKTMCMAQWAAEVGLNAQTLWKRLARGWSVEDAIRRPSMANVSSQRR